VVILASEGVDRAEGVEALEGCGGPPRGAEPSERVEGLRGLREPRKFLWLRGRWIKKFNPLVMKDWFTLNEAADFSGLGNTTIRSKIKSGDLKAVKRPSKYGPRWEIHREALLGFVEEQPFIDGEDLGGLRGVTIRVEDEPAESASKEPDNNERASEPSTPSDRSRRPSENPSPEALAVIQQALLVAEQAREDRLNAMLERDVLVEENDRLRRQLCEVQVLLGTERRLLAENSESLIEKEAAIKEQEAVRLQQAEEAKKARELAELEAHKARAEALAAAEKAKAVEEEQARLKAEAEEARAKLKEAEEQLEKHKPFWKRWFG